MTKLHSLSSYKRAKKIKSDLTTCHTLLKRLIPLLKKIEHYSVINDLLNGPKGMVNAEEKLEDILKTCEDVVKNKGLSDE